MDDDSDDSANFFCWTLNLQIYIFVIKMDNRLHFVSLTSNVKRAHKRRGDETLRQETLRKWTWWLSGGLLALR